MKLVTGVLTALVLLAGSAAYAQPQGGAAAAGSDTGNMAWGVGLGGLAVLGVVVGVVAASASSNTTPSTFTH